MLKSLSYRAIEMAMGEHPRDAERVRPMGDFDMVLRRLGEHAGRELSPEAAAQIVREGGDIRLSNRIRTPARSRSLAAQPDKGLVKDVDRFIASKIADEATQVAAASSSSWILEGLRDDRVLCRKQTRPPLAPLATTILQPCGADLVGAEPLHEKVSVTTCDRIASIERQITMVLSSQAGITSFEERAHKVAHRIAEEVVETRIVGDEKIQGVQQQVTDLDSKLHLQHHCSAFGRARRCRSSAIAGRLSAPGRRARSARHVLLKEQEEAKEANLPTPTRDEAGPANVRHLMT